MLDTHTPLFARRSLPCPPKGVDDFPGQPTPRVVEVLARTRDPFLVLGAGGKIGFHLYIMLRRTVDRLGRKDRVIAVSRFRTLRYPADFDARGIESVACDLTDPASLASLPDAPAVFFLAGVKFGTSTEPGLLHLLNVEMPQRVAARFEHSRIVAFSSCCIYPVVAASGGATELTSPAPDGDYAASCLAREQTFAAASAQHHNPVVLVRLIYSVELRDGLLVDIVQRALADHPVDVTMGHVNVIWHADAVAHSIQAHENASSPASPLNITGPDTLLVRDLAHRFGKLFQCPVRIAGTEAETVWLNSAARGPRLFGPPVMPKLGTNHDLSSVGLQGAPQEFFTASCRVIRSRVKESAPCVAGGLHQAQRHGFVLHSSNRVRKLPSVEPDPADCDLA